MSRKGSLLALRDRDAAPAPAMVEPEGRAAAPIARGTGAGSGSGSSSNPVAPSRQGKKAMTGYFSPEMSFAMHMTARKHGMSRSEEHTSELQSLMRISYAVFCLKKKKINKKDHRKKYVANKNQTAIIEIK